MAKVDNVHVVIQGTFKFPHRLSLINALYLLNDLALGNDPEHFQNVERDIKTIGLIIADRYDLVSHEDIESLTSFLNEVENDS